MPAQRAAVARFPARERGGAGVIRRMRMGMFALQREPQQRAGVLFLGIAERVWVGGSEQTGGDGIGDLQAGQLVSMPLIMVR